MLFGWWLGALVLDGLDHGTESIGYEGHAALLVLAGAHWPELRLMWRMVLVSRVTVA